MKWRNKKDQGFTLPEIMMVVAIIGLVATLALPAFVRARTSTRITICLNNMRIIDTAKAQFAMEAKKQNGDPVQNTDLDPYLKTSFADIIEPAGFDYVIGDVGELPTCTFGGTHVLGNPFP